MKDGAAKRRRAGNSNANAPTFQRGTRNIYNWDIPGPDLVSSGNGFPSTAAT
jgi:hypothetical protein